MEEVVWGLIGTGDVTEKKSGPALYKTNGSRLKGVFNRTKSKADSWVERHGHGVVYESAETLLADPEINAVYIATPPDSHYHYAMQAIDAGKIPLIEKPMALDYAECQKILDYGMEKGIPVYVNFYRRGLPKFQAIKKLLEEGAIGKPVMVSGREFRKPDRVDFHRDDLPWRLRPQAGGGKALDVQVHVLDYLAYFFGEITEVSGIAENLGGLYEVEDTVSASFRFESGVIGSVAWCYVADFNLDELVILGTEGRIVIPSASLGDGYLVRNTDEEQQEPLQFEDPEHVALPYIQMVVDELRGLSKSPADAVSAAHCIKVFDSILGNYRKRHTK